MNRVIINNKTIFNVETYEGETIENKMERIINNNEPIDATAPIIYTEKGDGVRPEFNIRADRFDIALQAMDAVSRSEAIKSKGVVIPLDNKGNSNEANISDVSN